MICVDPGPPKPLAILHRRSLELPRTSVQRDTNFEDHPWIVEDNMTKTAAGLSENPDSTEELVRDLEESGYPVDGATEQFVPQPDGLAAEKPGFPPGPQGAFPKQP
jgi:hypothetical protein